MPYSQKKKLTQQKGNNAFAWKERESYYQHSPTLTIPGIIDGTIDDIVLGEDIVFEEIEDGILRSCKGLQNFVRIIKNDDISKLGVQGEGTVGKTGFLHPQEGQKQEIIIFDNHNHALYFWLDAIRRGILREGLELIHIDEHSDLWDNSHELDMLRAIQDEDYAWEFTNLDCNVGNYIQPALRSGLVGSMIRIENEHQIDTYIDYMPPENSVLNLDIDIFAPELDHIREEKKIRIIQNLLKKVKYVTIATSPFFIDQGTAIEKIQKILKRQ